MKHNNVLYRILLCMLLATCVFLIPGKQESLNVAEAEGLTTGDRIVFGAWEQDNDTKNDAEPIEWIVLDVQDGRVLLISRYGLIANPYNMVAADTTWEKSSLRTWLNNDFLKKAFTTDEQAAILSTSVDNGEEQKNSAWSTDGGNDTEDKVFLLSFTEAKKYFESDEARQCRPTAYVAAQGVYVYEENGNCWWWLRSPGREQRFAAQVWSEGLLGYSDIVSSSIAAVRPVLWVDPGLLSVGTDRS